jgi:hypothetical protein
MMQDIKVKELKLGFSSKIFQTSEGRTEYLLSIIFLSLSVAAVERPSGSGSL